MKFNVFSRLDYIVQAAGTLVLNVHALNTFKQTIINEEFWLEPYVNYSSFQSLQGEKRLVKFGVTEYTPNLSAFYQATVDNCYEINDFSYITETQVSALDSAVLPYLNPSRYCESDKLYRMAHNMFGHISNPFQQVLTLTNWINKNVQYLSGSTNSQTSAFNTVTEQAGVCRDFAHLGIALCRALTIPARYFTGYAYQLYPADFHACFEAYLNGKWVLFDATGLVPLNGFVKIATGFDAADSAVANIFGDVMFNNMEVNCELAENYFEPFYYREDSFLGITYL
ncbi:transglutaminase-like domain-containing protein [Mucilaginibacter celer]|uniref:Transglutaminase family protein n=1 Tax=Mucilaginibacter celer TaxID=2305508 RepID=A0A494VQ12_9SPHI|nr:transglutaminase family protein [Mucilaginibacter celer]AYL96894.1 transglutaminase family protein [Mucilaginibacter celer]